jgi:hypothetical protein
MRKFYPTLHLNGSPARMLLRQYQEAYEAVQLAVQAMRSCAPHGRDYYMQDDPGAFEKARSHHDNLINKLVEVMDDLLDSAQHVQRQDNERKRR